MLEWRNDDESTGGLQALSKRFGIGSLVERQRQVIVTEDPVDPACRPSALGADDNGEAVVE